MSIPTPQQLFVEVTSNCNLRCPHCYVEAGSGRLRQIPLVALTELTAEFASMNGSRFTLSGGEPTLFKPWRETLLRARACGLEAEIITNATRLTDEDIDFLHRNRILIDISLESMDEKTNDAIRGSGAFAKTKDALMRIARAGLGPMTTVCFTPMAANADSLRDIAHWSEGIGIGRVYISLLEDRGRALANKIDVHMNATQRYQLLETVIDKKKKNDITVICPNLRFFP
ncbi:MAG: radical SAM protein, partial [Candidatus Thiodiazotropha endolucinida]